jgi:aromatic-L-amino-acid decarboxylase
VHADGDTRSREILEQINRDGRHHLTHTVLGGRYVIRVAIGSVKTNRSHVEALWRDLVALA